MAQMGGSRVTIPSGGTTGVWKATKSDGRSGYLTVNEDNGYIYWGTSSSSATRFSCRTKNGNLYYVIVGGSYDVTSAQFFALTVLEFSRGSKLSQKGKLFSVSISFRNNFMSLVSESPETLLSAARLGL